MSIPSATELAPKTITPQPLVPLGMRTFTVYREYDESGVSGTGTVIQGCLFANGKCAYQWLCKPDPGDTTTKDWEKFLDVHIRSHPANKTIITFDNLEQMIFDKEEPTIITNDINEEGEEDTSLKD